MEKTNLQRATELDDIPAETLNGWTPAGTPPPDDKIVLIARKSPIGLALLRDMGYYEDGKWLTVVGDPMHPVVFWQPYPCLPVY